MQAFLTGSRKYGNPRANSDYDLVVLMSAVDLQAIRHAGDSFAEAQQTVGYLENCSLRFGNLNLICTTDAVSYEMWAEGTRRLEERKPVARADAVTMFDALKERIRPTVLGKVAGVRLFHAVVASDSDYQRWPDFYSQIQSLERNFDDTYRFRWGVLSDWLLDHDEPELAHASRLVRDRPQVFVRKTSDREGGYLYSFTDLPATIAVNWSCYGLDVSTLAGALGVLARAIIRAKEDVA